MFPKNKTRAIKATNKTTNEINARDILDVVQQLNEGITENFVTKMNGMKNP